MIQINLDEIQRDTSSFLKLIQEGNILVIVEGDRPIAEIKPIQSSTSSKQLRPFGLCAGEFVVPDDFNEPLPDEIIHQFETAGNCC
ncbi:type II toxin-antitoxin system Phd/YefM family antitoxin [Aerosakkonema funiforme]|uniref:Type II toxin-antitoxin system Phd/YefM family antitoxin n=1 Tax=Aerosakkonema funiforme FACHB-1375 TaxID=2949571 RepID=A0A926ZJ26_9CYAN|nr:type II toxin-antitoxin system Phd/YefM family antitoxin [Aerosakkonema funiforme]MBD2184209.1 type II toxin-antitoxin system Phd/YefM family antitoxin [Aerosakkonema funiforme FACHB-1375]